MLSLQLDHINKEINTVTLPAELPPHCSLIKHVCLATYGEALITYGVILSSKPLLGFFWESCSPEHTSFIVWWIQILLPQIITIIFPAIHAICYQNYISDNCKAFLTPSKSVLPHVVMIHQCNLKEHKCALLWATGSYWIRRAWLIFTCQHSC